MRESVTKMENGLPMNRIKRLVNSGLFWIWIAVLVIFIDRVAKNWALSHLVFSEPLVILPVFNLTLAFNNGAAFSFFNSMDGGQIWLLGGLALAVSCFLLVWLAGLPKSARWESISLCLIIGGALGNFWDRITHGPVIDFFDFHIGNWHFAIFNTADTAICIGAFMMIIYWLFMNPAKQK